MPAAAEYKPSIGLLMCRSRPPPCGPAGGSWSSFVIGRGPVNLRRVRLGARERADLARGLLERLVDGPDHLLSGLEGAEGAGDVDHRAGGVHARALERARAHGAGAPAGGGAGEQVVADLARTRDLEGRDGVRVDL